MRLLRTENDLDLALSSRKEKAAPKILTETAQRLCDCFKDRCLTGTSRSIKPEERRRLSFAMDPV